MKFAITATLALALTLFAQENVNAQGVKLPQPSTAQTITQDFGLGKITISYSRPNVKGRTIFGELEPFGKVWRTGANGATTIKTTEPIMVEGKPLEAGEYGLFTIPGETEWTVIFNKTAKQWGAYEYKESDDVLRVNVKPINTKTKTETFTIQLNNVVDTTAQLQLAWENTLVNLNLSTSIDAKVMANITEAMKGDKKPYFAAAQYYYNTGKDIKTALEWMNEAEKADQKAPWIKLWKAKVQLKAGDKAGAAKTAQAGIDLAKAANNPEYVRLNTQVLEQAKK